VSDEAYFLNTERVAFRCWSQADETLATGLWGDPQVTKMLGGPFTDEQVRQRLAREIAMMNEHGIQYWPIFLRRSGEHVGCCGLRPYKAGIPELGFHLRQPFWGMGIAKEAGAAVIEYAFTKLGVDAVFAGHDPENANSRKVLLSLGFQFIGEELYPPTGTMHPSYLLRKADPSPAHVGS